MNWLPDSIKRFIYKIQGLLPTTLPVGVTAFNNWCDKLLFTYFPPNAVPPTEESFRFSIAAMILHLDHQKARVPNRFFGKAIQKGAANEVASFVMRDLKAKRDALIEAEERALAEKARQEATTRASAVVHGLSKQGV